MSLDANYPRLAPEAPRNARPEYVLELDDMQQFIVYGFKERHETRYVLLQITDAKAARAWLRAQLPPSQDPRSESPRRKHHVFGATRPRSEDEDKGVRVALAFTYLGLKVLGLDEATLSSFVPEFRQGMTEPHRARALGDEGRNSAERWLWGQWPDGEHPEHQVHVFCAAYAKTKAELAAWTRPSASNGFKEIDTVEATLNEHEPFGFRDGISQPYIKGSDKKAEK
ncbi:MAG TPA: hypothetical protein VGY54_07690, partial [Polyangiaceae bacterium]|nr:hypothetical protein [Polyangiaceae bacterium]